MKRSTLAFPMVLTLASCTGDINGSFAPGNDMAGGTPSGMLRPGGTPGTPGGTPGTPGGGVPVMPPPGVMEPVGTKYHFVCSDPQKQGVGDVTHRLTRTQLVNTLRDLLGADVVADKEIQTALNRIGSDVVVNQVKDILPAPSSQQPAALFAISVRAADLAATPDKVAGFFGACASQATVTDACASTFVTTFGGKALRHPLSGSEITSYLGTFRDSGGGLKGLRAVMIRMLQAPGFAFRIEIGETPSVGRARLNDHEIASRISYLVGDAMPDAPLFAAAAKGELQKLENVEAHARRLLDTASGAKAKLDELFAFYLELHETQEPHPGAAALVGIAPAGLAAEMSREAFDFVNYQVGRPDGKFRDLLTSTAVFPRSARMAKILETGVAAGQQPSQTNAKHAGVLLRPALLAGEDDRTPALHRGNRVIDRLLCTEIPEPDAMAVEEAIAKAPNRATLGNREWLTTVTTVPGTVCVSCHSVINPPAFALEGYDQLGMTRTSETTFRTNNTVNRTFPLDTTAKKVGIDPEAPVDLAGAEDLVNALAGGLRTRACFVRTAFEFYRLRKTVDADSCALRYLEAAATDGGSLRAFFLANVANEAIFWRGN